MKKLKYILLAEGFLSFGLAGIFYRFGVRNILYVLFAPFDFIGKELRFLSLHSTVGNIIAFILYTVFCLLPILYLLDKDRKSQMNAASLLPFIISIFSFVMLYEFINPDLLLQRMPKSLSTETFIPMIKLSFAITYYTLWIGFLILRMLGNIKNTAENSMAVLCKRLQKLLIIMSAIYTFILGYFMSFQMFTSLEKYVYKGDPLLSSLINQGTSGIYEFETFNKAFIIISYLLRGLPVLFSILTLVSGIKLIGAMVRDHMGEEEITAANRMGRIGKQSVYVTVFSCILINLLQVLFYDKLYDTSFNLELSLFPLIIAISAMILAGYFKETKELREDNEMII